MLSIRINDILLVDATKAEIISMEDKYSEDAKPGLWGYSFDLLRVNGTLPFTKIGGVIFYDYDDIQKMIENNKRNPHQLFKKINS